MSDLQKPRLLMLEDEPNVGSTLAERFEEENFFVSWTQSCQEALKVLQQSDFELALLDVGLPDGSGFEIADWIRRNKPQTAVIFLTAYGDTDQRIRGLEIGAEDYLVKPFHFKELLLRVQNVLRRSQGLRKPTLQSDEVGNAKIRWSSYEIESGGVIYPMTHKECAVLRLLFDHEGEVLSRDQILDSVWGTEVFPSHRTIDNFIVKFRKWIERDPENPEFIKSIRSVGYQLARREKK